MVPIANYYLGANPTPATASAATFSNRPQSMSYSTGPQSAPVGGSSGPGVRASMPPPARSPPGTAFVNSQQPPPRPIGIPESADSDTEEVALEATGTSDGEGRTSKESKRKSRTGTMNKAFKFPPEPPASGKDEATPTPSISVTEHKSGDGEDEPSSEKAKAKGKEKQSTSNIEVPPPPPVEKERTPRASIESEGSDDIGDDTVDIPL